VLGAAVDIKTLAGLLDFFTEEYAIAMAQTFGSTRAGKRDAGQPVHMKAQEWGFTALPR